MFFKNAALLVFGNAFASHISSITQDEGPEGLQALLTAAALKPVGPLEMTSSGFVSPFGDESQALFYKSEHFIWMSIGTQSKILPPAAVNSVLAKRLRELEEKEGRRPGGKTRKRIKDDVLQELLPKALVKDGRTDFYLDLQRGYVVVNASSKKHAENAVSELRRALGSFPATPVNAEVAPRSILTGWLAGEPLPEGLSLGEECELRDAGEGAVVRCSGQELKSEEIEKNLEAGKQATKIGVCLDDHVSFVICEDLLIRKIKLLDGAVDRLEEQSGEGVLAELEARFTLMTREFARVIDLVSATLKFSPVND
ncbi:recombination-associated protein RdgC [Xanthomonas euvesicatoria]